MFGLCYTPVGLERGGRPSLQSPAQSTWKTSPLVGTRSLLHPGQGWAPRDGRRQPGSRPPVLKDITGVWAGAIGQSIFKRQLQIIGEFLQAREKRKYCIPEDRGGQGGRRPASWLGRLVSCLPFNLPPGDKRHRQEEWEPGSFDE